MMFRTLGAFLSLLATLLVASTAHAADWPTRPIRFIVSSAAGGAPDILCRILTDRLSQQLGQPVIVENRVGGANTIGAQAAARSAPDGYTFFFASAAALVSNPYTFKSLPYDPMKDFVSVAMVAEGPFVFLAHPSVKASSIGELIALDKADPGKLIIATDGKRSFAGMLTAWFSKLAGLSLMEVPYPAMPRAAQDAVAGRVQLIVLALPIATTFITSGQLRPLAVSSAQRAKGYESIPSVSETVKGLDFSGWFALVAPTGTPADIVQRMNREMDRVLTDAELVGRFQTLGFYTHGADTPEATAAYIKRQFETWATIVKDIGIEPE